MNKQVQLKSKMNHLLKSMIHNKLFLILFSLVIVITITCIILFSIPNGKVNYQINNDHAEVIGYTGRIKDVEIQSEYEGKPVIFICAFAFQNCHSLKKVFIPDSIVEIRSEAFANCENLEEVRLPNNLETLNGYAFNECISLKTITIPHLETIEAYTFFGCTNLETISLPNNLKTILPYAFRNCENLNNIIIPEGAKEIDPCFQGCIGLTNITLPNSLWIFAEKGFYGCNQQITINYNGNEEEWESTYILYDDFEINTVVIYNDNNL